jgi:hypothetical protein
VLGPRDFQFDTQNGALGTTDDFTEPGVPSTAIPASQFPGENGWKDVVLAPPFTVTRLLIRLAPQAVNDANLQPGQNTFPFDPTFGPGYVWHCHILDHEDNDMMRPMEITFKDLPSLNSASRPPAPAGSTAAGGTVAASDSTPAVTAPPAHHHNGSTHTTEQKGSMPSPTPILEQQLK